MEFIFGKLTNRPELPPVTWNPDSLDSQNPHLLMAGGSGSGKTTLLIRIVKYLEKRKKHIFLFDLKGDMLIKDDNGELIGNYIDFTAWDSKYGINPFEFDSGVSQEELNSFVKDGVNPTETQWYKMKNAGPKVQIERFVEIIKKNFLPNMGAGQEAVLRYLFEDSYLLKGFKHNDIKTWGKELPSLEDTLDLIQKLKSLYGDEGQISKDDLKFILKCKKTIHDICVDNKEDNLESVKASEAELENLFFKYIENEKKSYVKTFKNNKKNKSEIENNELENLIEDVHGLSENGVDVEKYSNKETMRTVLKMEFYIKSLVNSGVFHSVRPPVKNGLNVINISGLDVDIQRFVVDVWLGKVFKSCKIRGTYADRKNKLRGEKCDTFAVVDESKLIAGTSREKNNPYSYLNRTATEARSFGFGLIVASQSAEHFPPEFLKNFDAQIVLNTSIADFEAVRKSFGIDKVMLEYTQKGRGYALVKTGKKFSKVKLEEGGSNT